MTPDELTIPTTKCGRRQAQMIPGWPYSFVVALEAGVSSWTVPLDVVRLRTGDDATVVTATQLRAVVGELTRVGHYRPGDLGVIVVMDAGYDVVRLMWLLADLPVTLIGRVRSDRVFYAPAGRRREWGGRRGRPTLQERPWPSP